MAAFTGTPVKSVEYTAQSTAHQKTPVETIAKLFLGKFTYVHTAGAGTGEIDLLEMPAGRIRVYPDLSRIVTSAFAANADIHLGYRAYVNSANVAVVADDNAFLDNGDAGGGAIDSAWVLPAEGFLEINSRNGWILTAMVDTGNIEDTDTISGWIAYTRG